MSLIVCVFMSLLITLFAGVFKKFFLSLSEGQMRTLVCVALLGCTMTMMAQGTESLQTGIDQFGNAVETMKKFVPIIKSLCYILAVIFGLIGGVLIVIAMNNHEQDVNKKIAMTVGAVAFMLVMAQVLPLIFGISAD